MGSMVSEKIVHLLKMALFGLLVLISTILTCDRFFMLLSCTMKVVFALLLPVLQVYARSHFHQFGFISN